MLRHTYQQTVTVIQLADDCCNEIYKGLTAHNPAKYNPPIIVSSDSVAGILHIEGLPWYYGKVIKYKLNGQYLAITDTHLWVMTRDELDSQTLKNQCPWETIDDEPEMIWGWKTQTP